MYKRTIYFILIISLVFGATPAFTQNYAITWYSFTQGGGLAASDNYGLSGAVGYGAFGNSSSQNYGVSDGFMQVVNLLNVYLGDKLRVYNFPNPFNPLKEKTTIKYFLSGNEEEDVLIRIYTISGRLVREIDQGKRQGGYFYFVDWNGRNEDDEVVASGVYILIIKAGSRMATFKIAVIK